MTASHQELYHSNLKQCQCVVMFVMWVQYFYFLSIVRCFDKLKEKCYGIFQTCFLRTPQELPCRTANGAAIVGAATAGSLG